MTDIKSKKADIVAVANAAKVSPSTVSRAFNHPDLVNPATRKRINRAVEKLGYIRNRAAQAIHGRRNATIGLIVPTINHAIFAEVIQSFSDAIDEAGFTLLIASHGYSLEREYDMIRKLMEHRVDGIALVGLEHSEATFRLLRQQDTPCIAIWNYSGTSDMPCVGADNREAGRLAARHLLQAGHRDIGLIFPSIEGNDRARQRLEGAMEEIRAHGVEVRDGWRQESPYSITLAKQAVRGMMDSDQRPTALVCGNDVIAQGAIFGVQSRGLSVPGDVSVIGIGDFNGSLDMEPGLTTVRIPAEDIGKVAGQRLTGLIVSETRELFRYRCDLKCIVRGTTRPLT
ncbi:LacI family DNA-binding transcriptional regulator [Roseovarius litoreus]|uniref:LacI family DNA-binding transcriptional regulator n=1 Tax=Roseovarius litoreus TaxID=1155722 RepID=UPI00122C417B|nr:LacI family DNA-binding transcriptional regulator [Roseovarius litoreus]